MVMPNEICDLNERIGKKWRLMKSDLGSKVQI